MLLPSRPAAGSRPRDRGPESVTVLCYCRGGGVSHFHIALSPP